MRGPITDKTRIIHILEAIEEIEKYLAGDTEIAWKPIRGFRNISIHEYFAVNFHLVWEIAQNDLPVLKGEFSKALASFRE
ncbi:DUF86 domain-containing protein [Pseudoflavitalea sp. X16]|uniref:HepT-like ribonuclease domain-containing protein n=1 Tax=Paraflavitalea devenefica TaxID=2716334 RepID=UPI00141FE4F9|nr:HepT-like ribonuclease domain-containing protein [Paraflavitalea devenefica]NII23798.1 DUF86 domain-containing protein [Paraflavitalea devenefica]